MSVDVDPTASLRAWPLTVQLGGQDFRLTPSYADSWLVILLEEQMDFSLILPGMLVAEDEERLESALMDGDISAREINDACLDVITAVAGRPWWWALRMVSVVKANWTSVYGALILGGVQALQVPLAAFLAAAYSQITARMDKEQRRQFDRDMDTPPAGYAPELNEEKEAQNFLALMNQPR